MFDEPNLKKIYYKQRKEILNSDSYKHVEENANKVQEPIYTIKTFRKFVDGLTYRRINEWENKGLIEGSRVNKKAGWRRFSIKDIIKLCIISDLRNIGFPINRINNVLENVSYTYPEDSITKPVSVRKKKKKKSLLLEFFILRSLACYIYNYSDKLKLLICEDDIVLFLTDEELDKIYKFTYASGPRIILPFSHYVDMTALFVLEIRPEKPGED